MQLYTYIEMYGLREERENEYQQVVKETSHGINYDILLFIPEPNLLITDKLLLLPNTEYLYIMYTTLL